MATKRPSQNAMTGSRLLARSFLRNHLDEGVVLLEKLSPHEVAAFLEESPQEVASAVVGRMTAVHAALCLGKVASERGAAIVAFLPLQTVAGLLRRMDPNSREALMRAMARERAALLERLLDQPEDTAAGLMDPGILTLPEDITVRDAVGRLRKAPEHAIYYVYVLDREQRLVGVLTWRELLLAQAKASLSSVMHRPVERLAARADRLGILSHPGWRIYHAIPVVDEDERFLGAIRYETFRKLEWQARPAESVPAFETAMKLGELFWLGLGGVLRGMTVPAQPEPREDR